MRGKLSWHDAGVANLPDRISVSVTSEEPCPLCGGKGYTVEPFGDCIENQGCICVEIKKKEREEDGNKKSNR